MIKFAGKPFKYNIIQVYMSSFDHADHEVEEIYEHINQLMRKSKNDEITIVMGDMNTKVGCKRENLTVGSFGLGERNEHGNCTVEFCKTKRLMITNAWFKMHPWRLYTWKSSSGDVKNQINYILVPELFRNVVQKVKIYMGGDCLQAIIC